MSCTKITKDRVIKNAERFAKFQKIHVIVVIRGGKCAFYDQKYIRESDEFVKEFNFLPKSKKVKNETDS